jgi:hypothetical protein
MTSACVSGITLMDVVYEIVHTWTDFWDIPRKGIANFQGWPHLYQSDYKDMEDSECSDTYWLRPVDSETSALALEDWEIWRRWETAFHSGETSLDTHPALPRDRARHAQIQALLKGRLEIDPIRAVRAEADFRKRNDPAWNGKGWPPLEVRWSVVADS